MDLEAKLSEALNRTVSPAMAASVRALYRRDSSKEGFARLVKVFGVRDDHVDAIYEMIRDPGPGDKEATGRKAMEMGTSKHPYSSEAPTTDIQEHRQSTPKRPGQPTMKSIEKPMKQKSIEKPIEKSIEKSIEKPMKPMKPIEKPIEDQKSTNTNDLPTNELNPKNDLNSTNGSTNELNPKNELNPTNGSTNGSTNDLTVVETEPNGIDSPNELSNDSPTSNGPAKIEKTPSKPRKIMFKKIKKEDALRIKGPKSGNEDLETEGHRAKKFKSEENIKDVRSDTGLNGNKSNHISLPHNKSNHISVPHNKSNHISMPHTNNHISMPHINNFSVHNKSNGGSTKPRSLFVVPHTTVPPFLEKTKHLLELSLEKVGPTVNPIKDPSSELAVAAKRGSQIVLERRQAKERKKVMRDVIEKEGNDENDESDGRSDKNENVKGRSDKNENVKGRNKKNDGRDKKNENVENDGSEAFFSRKKLPAYSVKPALVRTIFENQTTIVIGETGSGKTTQLPQFLREEGISRIACTQPRRVAATSVAKRVAEEVGCVLGQEVGYSVRFDDKSSPNTQIKYMTEGVLLRELLSDPYLEKYDCVVMDEAHERTLNTDILLGLLKALVCRRADLKVVVTSATMNADRFSGFFGDAPQFTIPGRSFPVETMHSRHAEMDYVDGAVKQVLTVHLTKEKGDILVFMTGQEDIETVCEMIRERLGALDSPPPLEVIPVYSSLPEEQQRRIFAPSSSRKVIVATNIAETSLTLDGVKYVIDSGLVKIKVYNPRLGMDALQVVPISLANAQQRAGRAGRTSAGTCFRLYTEYALEDTYKQPVPEIQRANLASVVLLLKTLGVRDVSSFAFLDPPPRDTLACALYDLWAMGALDDGGNLTSLGRSLALFPMDPLLAKALVLSANEFHCSRDMATLVAVLSVPNIFYRPKEGANKADMARERFAVANSDHLTLVNTYNQWEQASKKGPTAFWCQKNYVQSRSLSRAREIRAQIVDLMEKAGLEMRSGSDEDFRRCLAATFFQNAARMTKVNVHGSPEYASLRHAYMAMHLHPTSVVEGIDAKYVVYHELVLTSREYMSCVSGVEGEWLVEYGEKIYKRS